MRTLEAREGEELACLRATLRELRALIPLRYRERHAAARASARPEARPPREERPRCGARCRNGSACQAPVVWHAGEPPRRRCRMHGGASTGPRTPEGRARSLAAIGQAPRVATGWDEARLHLRPVDGCHACLLAARRCRGASDWLVRQAEGRGLVPADVQRVVMWTRCRVHAREQLAAWERAGRRTMTLTVSRPCP